jgi:bacillithiol biosynthesis cysteine-adding enzyme BshC
VTQEIACPAPSGDKNLRIETIPFGELPGQQKLFTEYQSDPLKLRKYYPSAVGSHTEIAARIDEVLRGHNADRTIVCNALEETNKRLAAPAETLANIELLRQERTVAVVTGQQAGLFTGPAYTIYKALSAIREAECLRGRGHSAVPVFWVAGEDHDFDEVSTAAVLDREGKAGEVAVRPDAAIESLPVGRVMPGDTINKTIDELFDALTPTEFTSDVRKMIEAAWRPDATFGDAFGAMLLSLLGRYGLIVLDPLDARLKSQAAPIYSEAIRRSDEIVEALIARSGDIEADGFAPQVLIEKDYFPLFWHDDQKMRIALRRTSKGKIRTKDGSREFSTSELAEIAVREPERFSPSVVLRSVVQDHLLPTVCYFGGGAEVAYFAQSGEVYRLLGRPLTPIIHRQSFTVVEARHARTMERYGLSFKDVMGGIEPILPLIVDGYLNKGTAALIADVEERINTELNRLDQNLSEFDPTLAANLATRRRKILYHIGAIREKFRRSEISRDETVRRQIDNMLAALATGGQLQERGLNITYFLNRYGSNFIDWVYDSIDLDDKGHRIIYL